MAHQWFTNLVSWAYAIKSKVSAGISGHFSLKFVISSHSQRTLTTVRKLSIWHTCNFNFVEIILTTEEL